MGYISIRALLYVLTLAGNYFASGRGGWGFYFPCAFPFLFFLFFPPVYGVFGALRFLGVVEDRLWHICRWLKDYHQDVFCSTYGVDMPFFITRMRGWTGGYSRYWLVHPRLTSTCTILDDNAISITLSVLLSLLYTTFCLFSGLSSRYHLYNYNYTPYSMQCR